jgi:hypothetical protein
MSEQKTLDEQRRLAGLTESLGTDEVLAKLTEIHDEDLHTTGRLRVPVRKAFEQEYAKFFAPLKQTAPDLWKKIDKALGSAENEILLGFQKAATEVLDLWREIKRGDLE